MPAVFEREIDGTIEPVRFVNRVDHFECGTAIVEATERITIFRDCFQ